VLPPKNYKAPHRSGGAAPARPVVDQPSPQSDAAIYMLPATRVWRLCWRSQREV